MEQQQQIQYNRIAAAIEFIQQNFKQQPSLEQVAEQVHLSPFHFQRLFTDWAGVSPKQFLQFTSVQYAKSILVAQQPSLFELAYETGLSGTGRLHDLFTKIEGMTPGEYKNGGAGLCINYSYATTVFGNLIIASTSKGICFMAFEAVAEKAFQDLVAHFPNAAFTLRTDLLQENALLIFTQDWSKLSQLKLHLRGTDFQIKVWESLLKIPVGGLTTYGKIAQSIQQPTASRAVGTAIGSNPVAFLIPCHRVIQASGVFGGYRWGATRKTAMIGWEAAKNTTVPEM